MVPKSHKKMEVHFKWRYFPAAVKVKMLNIHDWIPNEKKPKWLGFIHENKPYKLEEIDITQVLAKQYSKIEKVINPYLERSFELKKSQSDLLTISVFHGTRHEYMISIIEKNFNWRYSGRSHGYAWGRGVCFSPKIEYTYKFCGGPIDELRIIQSKVIYKKIDVGSVGDLLPKPGYDTTKSSDGYVFVKYEDSEFLPTYVIHINTKYFNFQNCFLNLFM